jgi:membrane-associated protease RseP (regulator of RpoE activity)
MRRQAVDAVESLPTVGGMSTQRSPGRTITILLYAAGAVAAATAAESVGIHLLDLARNVAAFVVLLVTVVCFHEMGHLVVARRLGVRVTEFGVGFGRRIVSREWRGITWGIHILPLGGFVRLAGEGAPDGGSEPDLGPDTLGAAPLWRKVAIFLAGPAASLLLSWLVFMAAAIVLRIGNRPVFDFGYAVLGAFPRVLSIMGDMTGQMFGVLGSLLPGLASDPMHAQVSGLPGMITASGAAAGMGLPEYAWVVAVISLSLGIMNALPIFPLDGGQAMLAVVERAGRGWLSPRVLSAARYAGLALILVVMAAVTAVDTIRTVLGLSA